MRVFVSRLIPDAALNRIRATCEMDLWDSDEPPPYDELTERVRGVDGLLCMLTDKIDAQLMDSAGENLKVISQMAVGYNNIDVVAAHERKIKIGNTPGLLTEATADLTLALLLAAARRIPEGITHIRDGHWKTWKPMELLGHDLVGATLGIIGFGRIGKAVAKRAQAFDLTILAYSPSLTEMEAQNHGVRSASLLEVLQKSDFVSIHTPLNAKTHHLINHEMLKLMKPNAILINTSRGGVVDQKALYQALRDGIIGGAALDVTDPEPILLDDPILTLPNVLIVPHIGSATTGTRTKMALMAADNLIAGIRGDFLPNAVTIKPR